MTSLSDWAGLDGDLDAYIGRETEKSLEAYRAQPNLIIEHGNHEADTARGGYAHRQLFELIQNSADALAHADGGRIEIRLTPTHLYCVDEGRPVDESGVQALMFSHSSSKRGTMEIGRFGLGFKSVLGVSDAPEFFSRAGSFRFARAQAVERLRQIAPNARHYPVLRLPEAIDVRSEARRDPILLAYANWATNIVRLPLKAGAYADLSRQMENFPPAFLLFVEHVSELNMRTAEQGWHSTIRLRRDQDLWILDKGDSKSRWKLFKAMHELSPVAQDDRRSLDNADVPITWAVPIDDWRETGRFWAFFPTVTASLLAGIVNAPWKTNEDRQNLLPGPYNDELIDAAASLVAEALPQLATREDPARHLDALPRRQEAGDAQHGTRLRKRLYAHLRNRALIPDQEGKLQRFEELFYPPRELTSASSPEIFTRWSAHPCRPANWLHHSALTRNRQARLSIIGGDETAKAKPSKTVSQWLEALVENADSKAMAVQASMAAIQVAVLIPNSVRTHVSCGAIVFAADGRWKAPDQDEVFLGGKYAASRLNQVHPALASDPDIVNALQELGVKRESPQILLEDLAADLLGPKEVKGNRDDQAYIDEQWRKFWRFVNALEESGKSSSDHSFLKQASLNVEVKETFKEMNLKCESPKRLLDDIASQECLLEDVASHFLGAERERQEIGRDLITPREEHWLEFWNLVRETGPKVASEIIREQTFWQNKLRVRTVAGFWRSFCHTLLPGCIVPADGSRDGTVAIDQQFHQTDLDLLKNLGAVEKPQNGISLSAGHFWQFRKSCRDEYRQREDLPQNVQLGKLEFQTASTAGPLDVLKALSAQGGVLYTEALLDLSDTYKPWIMFHISREIQASFASPVLEAICKNGYVSTDNGIRPISDVLNRVPDKVVFRALLDHPKGRSLVCAVMRHFQDESILEAWHNFYKDFNLASQQQLEPVGEDEPFPLLDQWPELLPHVNKKQKEFQVIRCDQFSGTHDVDNVIVRDGIVYILRKNEEEELRSILTALDISLSDEQIEKLLHPSLIRDVEEARANVARHSTDAERLMAAVGKDNLRSGLPKGVLVLYKNEGGLELAEAAIAHFHTNSLREYRRFLTRLDPPKQWAGSSRAVAFVRSLGFGAEWAGERNVRRAPYIEVKGPTVLPALHDYQRKVLQNLKDWLRSGNEEQVRRGLLSMPTGSGKTRVAVQAMVEAIRDNDCGDGILWVADRGELCEQAVEAWCQVWSSMGSKMPLRISRMWEGQPSPIPTSERHVIVATIQTLASKIKSEAEAFRFLADFNIVVFDEAHRSVAPTFTSVMAELGLTRRQGSEEPFLLGLTATPYRGHNEEETQRLANRYGKYRLDKGAFGHDDPEGVIRELQEQDVLAQADHATIQGGQFRLSDDERRETEQVPWLPQSVEKRIAEDSARTRRILEAYEEHVLCIDPDWPTLIFATSVDHAQALAGLLSIRGVAARAVSAQTDSSIRRRIVEDFREGEIKALVNYGIFTEGFDAPKTRVIIVARPVYSPNLYFQMIGRGLRGAKNGGSERCLILNVEDNIENFQRKLAFSELDWLWA